MMLVSVAFASDPEFAGGEKPGQAFATPETRLSAEFGGAWASGNTDNYTRRWRRNKLSLALSANLGRGLVDTDGDGRLSDAERAAPRVETARKYVAEGRYDRFVGVRDSLYLLGGVTVDPFAGYDDRAHAQAGWSRAFADTKDLKVLGELGADVAREDFVDGVEPNVEWVYAARLMGGLHYAFNASVALDEQAELYENILDLEDLRVLNTAALTAKLDASFSLRLSHQLTFDNVPVEGFRPTDQVTLVTFVATIL
jgi:putative salt-induced outer membrane protein YdiY